MVGLKVDSKVITPDSSINEVKHVVSELKTGKCSDSTGLIHEVSKNTGDAPLHSICDMAILLRGLKPYHYSGVKFG